MANRKIERFGLFDSIDDHFEFIKGNPIDQRGKDSIQWMWSYMDTLYKYAVQCNHITEIGVNQVNSTWAFLKAAPKRIVLVDIDFHRRPTKRIPDFCGFNMWLGKAMELAIDADISMRLIEGDSAEIEIEPTDLLFIDSDHKKIHFQKELDRHLYKVSKYLIVHDTTLFGSELWPPIRELIESNQFILTERITTGCGLTVLQRNRF